MMNSKHTMKDNLFLSEALVSLAMVVVLVVLLNPFSNPIPHSIFKLLSLELMVNFGLFASFIARERAKDEVRSFHGMVAGKAGYLTGGAILVYGIIMQTFRGELDPWLVITLGGMILIKIFALIYGKAEV